MSNNIAGMSQISIIIKSLRAAPVSLSQSEISRRTGIPQPRVSRWEAGDVSAGADDALKLVALAKEMGVEACYLVDQSTSTTPVPAETAQGV